MSLLNIRSFYHEKTVHIFNIVMMMQMTLNNFPKTDFVCQQIHFMVPQSFFVPQKKLGNELKLFNLHIYISEIFFL